MSDYESMTFEQLLVELEAMTRRMAAGDIGIEEAVSLYEKAGELYRLAGERLDRVQQRLDALGGAAGERAVSG